MKKIVLFYVSVVPRAVLIVALLGTNASFASDMRPDAQQLLVHGGTIITMYEKNAEVEALLVENGVIKALGSMEEMLNVSQNPLHLNLNGKTILPGFIDSHVHVHQLGAEKIKANLVGADSVEEMVSRLRGFYPAPRAGQWLVGQGWDEGKWASMGYPDRKLLDAAFPDNPVYLQSLHGFAVFCNKAALDIGGVNRSSADPEVGQILKRKNGQPTGVLLTLARELVKIHIPDASVAQRKRAIREGMLLMAAAGVTSIHEAGIREKNLQAFMELRQEDNLPIRVYGFLDGNNEALMQKMFTRGPIIDPEYWLTIRGIKVYYDGSLGSRTALLRAPYSDKPEEANMTERISPQRVASLASRAVKHGFQLAVHAIGDEGNDRTLNIYENALKFDAYPDHRWRIEHAQVVLPDYYQRVASMGVISSMQSSHAVGDSAWAEQRVGADRIRHAYAWQNILKAGGKLIINSDLPGEPWRPVNTLHFAVTRQNLADEPIGGWYSDQRLTVMQALKAMTSEGAYAAFQEDKVGSLKAGAYADFVILDKDPRTTKLVDLKNLEVVATWVNGKRVWQSTD